MNVLTPLARIVIREADLHEPRESRRIEDYVAEHPEGSLFHRPAWSRAVERGARQRSHYLIAEDSARRLVGCLPLTEVRSPFFGNALVSAGFGSGGGVIADDMAVADRLARVGWELAERLGCPTMELRGGPLPEGWQAKGGIYASFVKDLPKSEAAMLKSMKDRARLVRRAREFGLQVRTGRSPADLADHFAAYSASVRNLGTPIYPRGLFAAMLDEFGEDADILTVFKGGRLFSSVLSFYFKNTVKPYWGGGTREARDVRANDYMYYMLMSHGSRRGCSRFDFDRSKVGTGPYANKKLWGFEPQPLVYGIRTARGAEPRDINPLNPKYRLKIAMWQRLPLPVANRIGPILARGLG